MIFLLANALSILLRFMASDYLLRYLHNFLSYSLIVYSKQRIRKRRIENVSITGK